jgi:pimeloyl-ACP methyl ester carboxylesterase
MEQFPERHFDTGTMLLSGLEAAPASEPRCTVIAIHGSGYASTYWDLPEPLSSLLRLGRDLGFRVIAVDRPGYGAASGIAPCQLGVDAQAAILGELTARIHAESPAVPVFLMGHSFGALLVVRVAAGQAADQVAGIDVAGLPVQWRPEVRAAVEARLRGEPSAFSSRQSRLALYLGPPGTFDPHVLDLERTLLQRVPRKEIEESLDSARMLQESAPLIRMPVQYTVAQYEGSIAGGQLALSRGRALFSAAPRVASYLQVNAGHNVSLHKVGRAYHLRAFTFFEEVLASIEPAANGVPGLVGRVEAAQ